MPGTPKLSWIIPSLLDQQQLPYTFQFWGNFWSLFHASFVLWDSRDFVFSSGRHDYSCLQDLNIFLPAKTGLVEGVLKFFSVCFLYTSSILTPVKKFAALLSLNRNPNGDSAMNFTHTHFSSFTGISHSWSSLHPVPILGFSSPLSSHCPCCLPSDTFLFPLLF